MELALSNKARVYVVFMVPLRKQAKLCALYVVSLAHANAPVFGFSLFIALAASTVLHNY